MFRRLSNLVRGFFSLFISGIERQNPEALLEVEQEILRKQIGQYNQGLATHAGLCERLISQVRQLESEQKDLRAKATANLRAGNRDAAAQYALRLQTIERELDENRAQLEQAEKMYKDLVKARDVAITAARNKIEALKSGISDLKMKRAMAELTEMASGMITNIGGSGETLDRLSNIVEEERSIRPAFRSRNRSRRRSPTRRSRTSPPKKELRWIRRLRPQPTPPRRTPRAWDQPEWRKPDHERSPGQLTRVSISQVRFSGWRG